MSGENACALCGCAFSDNSGNWIHSFQTRGPIGYEMFLVCNDCAGHLHGARLDGRFIDRKEVRLMMDVQAIRSRRIAARFDR